MRNGLPHRTVRYGGGVQLYGCQVAPEALVGLELKTLQHLSTRTSEHGPA